MSLGFDEAVGTQDSAPMHRLVLQLVSVCRKKPIVLFLATSRTAGDMPVTLRFSILGRSDGQRPVYGGTGFAWAGGRLIFSSLSGLTGVTLAFGFSGLAIRGVLRQQQLAQGL